MTSSIPVAGTRTTQRPGPHAVLLDLDGTLVDTEGLWWTAEAEVFAELGHVLDEVHRSVVVGGPMSRSLGHLMSVTGTTATLAELTLAINTRFEQLIARGAPLMPGARRLLAELSAHGTPTALVSASYRTTIDAMLRSLGPEHFAFTLAGDEVSRTKPDPEPYLTAAARLGAAPADCVVVEDTPTGVASALAAGCQVIAVPSVAPIAPAPGVMVVRSLEDVTLPFLRAVNTRIH
ncbi:HAD family phosphatase [Streptomyces sp. V4-01]|uniref:HAD family phosphatase n=1 Tax=Actinacidiphila polyblastidii TaxID=3110430 RepID=A0ABU7PFJ1_9ACTN|nr:HAD family phosphatase [Streptomyces sp. V4-01]